MIFSQIHDGEQKVIFDTIISGGEIVDRQFFFTIQALHVKEGMEGHARAADIRLRKYFPGETFDFEVYDQKSYV